MDIVDASKVDIVAVSKNKVVSGDGFVACTEAKVENDDRSKLVFGQSGGSAIIIWGVTVLEIMHFLLERIV